MLIDSSGWSLATSVGVFSAAAVVIAFAGWRLAAIADRLADQTGLGEAIAGVLFLGATTSLPGIITSALAAAGGHAELAVSNALGGIAAQTAFLVVADVCYRRANLEHAAASAAIVMQGTLLITLLALLMLAMAAPPVAWWGVHPVSPISLAAYIYGLQMIKDARTEPMWRPRQTQETKEDEPEEEQTGGRQLMLMWGKFAVLALLVASAGWMVERSALPLSEHTGLGHTVVGGVFTAISTSLPELVTSVAAVRRGALTLAVSGIIGGNAFDTLFVAVSDIAYRDGSIYHAITQRQQFLMTLTVLMTGVLLMGLVRRERRGIANIGFESFLILVLYVGSFVLLGFGGLDQ